MNSRCLLFMMPDGMCCARKASRNLAYCTWLAGWVVVKLAHHALVLPSNCWTANNVCIVEKLKLGLNIMKPMVGLQRLTCFNEGWRLDGQKFHIGASCLLSTNADSGSFTDGVGHKETQQLGFLVPWLMDWWDDLSHGRWRRRVPIRLSVLGIRTSIISAHHAIMKMTYR
jgi:hypothetical protein